MHKLVYDLKAIQLMGLFENVTKSRIKDCIPKDNKVIFVVQKGEIAKAIGAKGIHVKNLERALKKRVKIAEFDEDCKTFINNYVQPLRLQGIEEKDKLLTLKPEDFKTRGILIGRQGINLKELESIVKRYFDIDKIRVT